MANIEIPGLGTVPIAGTTPTPAELEGIRAALETKRSGEKRTEMQTTDREIAGWSQEPDWNTFNQQPPQTLRPRGAEVLEATGQPLPTKAGSNVRPLEFKDAPSIARLPALDALTNPGVFGSLMTESPKARQEIILKQLDGATKAEDRYGNPMVEYKGVKYYMSRGGEADATDFARAGAATIMTAPFVATAPASVPGLLATGAAIGVGQSVAEDLIAKATGGESLPWVNVEKAMWSGAFGAFLPALLKSSPALAGRFNEYLRSGQPLTDDALKTLGFTPTQIESLTPDMRTNLKIVADRSFNDPKAVGGTYRKDLMEEFAPGGQLTKGEISGDPAQIAREQTLSQRSDVPGRADAADIIQSNRAAQDAALNKAQEQLRVKAGGRPGQPPMTPEEASAAIKSGYGTAFELTDKAVDRAYTHARDPAAIVAAGGTPDVAVSHAGQFGNTVRTALEANDKTRVVLGGSGVNITPNAKQALDAANRFSDDAAKSNANLSWQQVEDLRQELIGYRETAAKAGGGRDLAAVKEIIASFDEHFGNLNPLYKPARAANEEMMRTFVSGAGQEQDAATKQVLKVLDSPEGGSAVTNVILGGHVNNNTAGQMIDHLKTKVFPDQPEMHNVLKEQFLRRLTVDKDGAALSPTKIASAIDDAFGERQGSLYAKLFSADELKELRRFQELMKTIGSARDKINPNPSGLIMQAVMKAGTAANAGTVTGGLIGGALGTAVAPLLGPAGQGAQATGALAGGWLGRKVGATIDALKPPRVAAQAVSPPPGYTGAAPSPLPGLLARPAVGPATDRQQGPADRIMDSLLMP